MTMNVGIFKVSANHPRFSQTLEMFAKGVLASGDQVFISDSAGYESCDIAVFLAHGRIVTPPNIM